MGLFSFVGKAVKSVVKTVAKTALGAVKSTALGAANAATGGAAGKVIKIGGLILKSNKKSKPKLLAVKQSMNTVPVLKAEASNPMINPGVSTGDGSFTTMPGGAPLPVANRPKKRRRATTRRYVTRRRSTARRKSTKKRSAGYVTYKGKRYTKRQAKYFVPSRR